jgi:hypothetical protein
VGRRWRRLSRFGDGLRRRGRARCRTRAGPECDRRSSLPGEEPVLSPLRRLAPVQPEIAPILSSSPPATFCRASVAPRPGSADIPRDRRRRGEGHDLLATSGSLPLFFIHQPFLKRSRIATLLLPVLNSNVTTLTVARLRDRPLTLHDESGAQILAVTAQLKLAHWCRQRFSRPPRTSRKPKPDKGLRSESGDVAHHLPTDTCRTSSDLNAVIDAWSTLPEAIRAGILAMVRASKPTA